MMNKIYIGNTQQNFKKRMAWRKESTQTPTPDMYRHHQGCSGTSSNATFYAKATLLGPKFLVQHPLTFFVATDISNG
jgi:hypothetical protein